jgi:UDP-N-acetylglucosamine--N-acetylmuramyl-(pentapeptide) pyrophosphoryl-undecaprenol N-acetylglucosamine transferase
MRYISKGGFAMKIWIATGGTGGHVFPALAVAGALSARGHRVMVSSDGRTMEMVKKARAQAAESQKFGRAFVWAGGVGARSRARQAWSLLKIFVSAAALVARFMFFRPRRVISFGGYASVPAVLAARIWRIPTLLHEQNAAIGRANAFALRMVGTLMTSFPSVSGIPKNVRRVVYTGLPVRGEFSAAARRREFGGGRILVTGGSLGASVLDDVVPAAAALLPAGIRKKLFVVHQTRPSSVAALRALYERSGIRANVLSFIHDMANEMAAADIAIGRSGASTVAELQTLGVPAILVPLSINPDQPANAAAFAKTGGGIVIAQDKFTPKMLAAALGDLLSNPARLKKMSDAARVANNAVENIVKETEK